MIMRRLSVSVRRVRFPTPILPRGGRALCDPKPMRWICRLASNLGCEVCTMRLKIIRNLENMRD